MEATSPPEPPVTSASHPPAVQPWRRPRCWPSLLLMFTYLFIGATGCPANCNGHGFCLEPDRQVCQCISGWTTADCSQRVCPSGRAWADVASANNVAHRELTECSNMGVCDRKKGECICRKGFEGAACDRMSCPVGGNGLTCSGHGKCLSMREAGDDYDPEWGLVSHAAYNGWDADMVYGCSCQEGYAGYDCSEIECPRADDPVTPGVDEIQVIDCQCVGCSGSFTLSYQGQSTRAIPWDATAEFVKYRLLQIPALKKLTVQPYNLMASERRVCSDNGTATAVIFHLPVGNLSALSANTTNLRGGTTSEPLRLDIKTKGQSSRFHHVTSQAGTKEWAECANRGSCDRRTGTCTCLWLILKPSDQMGQRGNHLDCGYLNNTGNLTTCPIFNPYWGWYTNPAICSGAGTCSNETYYKCNCTAGYKGNACEYKDCPKATAWFDEAMGHGTAHRKAECSNRGLCTHDTGVCTCDSSNNKLNFIGSDCNKLDCGWSFSYATNTQGRCGDRGQCLTMAQLALLHTDGYGSFDSNVTYNASWDSNMIQSCRCPGPFSTDNQGVSVNHNWTYRGPYAYASTAWKGYDCSKAKCPSGDYSRREGLNEVQRVNCTATNGSFIMWFRGMPSAPIYFNSTKEVFKQKLEDMRSITTVRVIFNTDQSAKCKPHMSCAWICNENNMVDVEFLTEFGKLPLMTADVSLLGGNVTVRRRVEGTRQDLECSRLGVCNEDTGQCKCLEGWSSSSGKEVYSPDGSESMGHRGDCGWRNPHSTAAVIANKEIKTPSKGTSQSFFSLEK